MNVISPTSKSSVIHPDKFDDAIPELLLGILERRYLNQWSLDHWNLTADAGVSGPILHEVRSLGVSPDASAMSVALSASHQPGQCILGIVYNGRHAEGGWRHRHYFGSRRQPGGPSTSDFLRGFTGSMEAHFPGMEFESSRMIPEMGPFGEFLRSAPAAAAITGIPSSRQDRINGLEILARCIGGREYAVVIVAEPLPLEDADIALDACRNMQTEISGLLTSQRTQSTSRTEQVNPAQKTTLPGFQDRLPMYLQQSAMYLGMACGMPGLSVVGIGLNMAMDYFKPQQPAAAQEPSVSTSSSESISSSYTNATLIGCNEVLASHVARIRNGRGWGWWRTAIYVLADSEATLQMVGRAIRSASAGEDTGLDPMRIHTLPPAIVRRAIQDGRIYSFRPRGHAPTHPLGAAYDALATCMSSQELAALAAPPKREVPGLILRERGEFPVNALAPFDPSIPIGVVRDILGAQYAQARLTARHLNEHILVVGTPGFGKTNSCMNLLIEADREFHTPFLVIEPEKQEYRRLTKIPGLGPRLKVYTLGSTEGRQLRLNPLAPAAGASLAGHIDSLKAVFNASFALGPGMPQILEEALYAVYEQRGWNLTDGTNSHLGPHADEVEKAALTPCLMDLHDTIDLIIQQKGYVGEIKGNLAAALKSRIKGLTMGSKGASLNSRTSTSSHDLFECPVVLELRGLGDGDEKSFVMALVFMLLAQHCDVRQSRIPAESRERLQHITLIEEAHRLLSASPAANAESADPRGKAVSMFTDLLAELRSLGEGFIIAEQIPSKLASDVLKNTNVKILHRLTSPSDRSLVGQSTNLTEAQMLFLASEPKGVAIVHGIGASPDDPIAPATLVQMILVKGVSVSLESAELKGPQTPQDIAIARRHGGCRSCPSPCDFFAQADLELRNNPQSGWIKDFVDAALSGDFTAARKAWSRPIDSDPGLIYCEHIHRIRAHLASWLAHRGMNEDRQPRLRPQDRILVERLTAVFGKCLIGWIQDTDTAGNATFVELHGEIQALLSRAQPPGLVGCRNCLSPCKMLAAVSRMNLTAAGELISQAIPRVALDPFGKATATDTRVARVIASLPVLDSPVIPSGTDPSGWRRDWRYCLLNVVPLAPEKADFRPELLAGILKSSIG